MCVCVCTHKPAHLVIQRQVQIDLLELETCSLGSWRGRPDLHTLHGAPMCFLQARAREKLTARKRTRGTPSHSSDNE